MNIVSIACMTGFIGDASLQLFVNYLHLGGPTGWGLKPYFKQHGPAESTFIAGGMMTLFYVIYIYFAQMTYIKLAIYGIVLDFIFRKTMIFASLKGYYEQLNYFWSAVWGAIPMLIPFAIFQLII
jgi:hypothetical protein